MLLQTAKLLRYLQDGITMLATKSVHPLVSIVAYLQGAYYAVTGIWPLIHINSFEAVTGPKTDDWLVQTVGLLVLVTGIVLLVAAWRRRITVEIVILACGNAVSLALVDLVFVTQGRIAPIYLADALAEVVLIFGWATGAFLSRNS